MNGMLALQPLRILAVLGFSVSIVAWRGIEPQRMCGGFCVFACAGGGVGAIATLHIQ